MDVVTRRLLDSLIVIVQGQALAAGDSYSRIYILYVRNKELVCRQMSLWTSTATKEQLILAYSMRQLAFVFNE